MSFFLSNVNGEHILRLNTRLNDLRGIQDVFSDSANVSSAAVQEKRGHRESRLLENLNKMVQDTNEQMQPENLEDMNQQLSDVIARCKSPPSESHLRLCFKLYFSCVMSC